MKKIFLTGVGGQLGSELGRIILSQPDKYELVAPTRKEIDLIELESLIELLSIVKPDIIIHAAAYTNVAQAEIDKDICYQDTVVATFNLVNACKLNNAVFVYISTDFVFDGKSSRPYKVTDLTNPVNYYGVCKLEAEKIVQSSLDNYFIVRTSWLFSHNEGNFLTKVLYAANENNNISVVIDEFGSPTSTLFLSRVVLILMEINDYGLYHVSNQGSCSRHEFASMIVNLAGINCNINPTETHLNVAISRPKYSVLDNNWLIVGMKHQTWIEALSEVLSVMNY